MSENENKNEKTPSGQGDPAQLGDAGKAALVAERKRADDAEKALRDAQTRLKQIEDAEKTDLEKAQARITELEGSNQKLIGDLGSRDLEILRLNTGIDAGLSRPLIARLQGTDEDSFKADAEALKGLIPDSTNPFPKADPSQGGAGAQGKKSTGDLFAAAVKDHL